MCALAAVSVLLQALIVDAWAWIPVRAVSGFCFAGAAMIVESWLNDRAEPSTRGTIFGVYTMVNLVAATAGQMAISLGRRQRIPVLRRRGHRLLPRARADRAVDLGLARAADIGAAGPRALWRNSPVAVVAVFLVGVSNAAFGTLRRSMQTAWA
jgi:MFS family permease